MCNGQPEVEFNGHIISAAGIRPLKSNVEAILRIPTPKDQRELLRFVCTASYYLRFVKDYAALSESLRRLLRANVTWHWSAECETSFREIKRRLASPPILAHFDVSADTILTCDASSTAIGACLSQISNGDVTDRPVAFISRSLTKAERSYSASEREALACLWACERLTFFLYGRHFRLVTDHQALKTMLTAVGTGHRPLRLHRWADRLLQFNFSVVFRPGKDNVVADCLSRSYSDNDTPTMSSPSASSAVDPDDEDEQLIQTVFGSIATPVVTLEAVAAATDADDVLRTVRDYVINGWPNDRRNLRAEIRMYFDVQHELSVCGRCLIRDVRTVIPASLTAAILDIAHEGHPGIVRMKQRCRETVWWPGIDIAIERYVRDCEPCILSGKSAKPRPGPLQPIPLPSGPWRKLSLDIAGEFVAAPHHQRYVIVATDVYSKWPEVAACGSPTSSAVIEFLTSLFDRFGLVEEIITDNGVQFVSSEFEDFLAAHSIKHSRSALYSPQTNAAVERLNRVIKEGVKVALAEGKSFMTGLRQVMAAYRTTPHATTGVTPASLMLAFPVRTPLSVLSSLPSSSRSSTSSQTDLRKRVSFKQSEMAKQYNQRHRAAPTIIKPGDSVRILLPTQPHKLARVYSEPRLVDKVKGNTIWLRNGQRWNVRRCLLHCSVLKQPPSTSRSSPAMTHAEHAGRTIDNADESDDCATFVFPVAHGTSTPPPADSAAEVASFCSYTSTARFRSVCDVLKSRLVSSMCASLIDI
jgi:transposase InsO family protein